MRQRSFLGGLLVLCVVPLLASCAAGPGPEAEPHYLHTYFTGNGETGLHYAYSQDGLNWRALNGGQPILAPAVGEAQLMRDPSIVRGPDGVYHMVWTAGWRERGIGYASSADLINWSEQRYLEVMGHEPEARNTWAPELFYDDATDQFLIVWATTILGRFPEGDVGQDARGPDPGWNHRQYYVATRDFQTFTETALFYQPDFNVIDAAIFREGDRYYMVVKDETAAPLTPQKNLRLAWADHVEGPWSPASPPITGDYWAEGPSPLKVDGRWHIYFDKYIEGRYGVIVSDDLETWEDLSDQLVVPRGMRHGTAFQVPADIIEPLLALDR
jgi:hypothetical protein